MKGLSFFKKKENNKKLIIGVIAIIAVAAITIGAYSLSKGGNLKPEAAKTVIENYINANLMAPGATAKINSINEENGLYKLMVDIGGEQTVESYATLDGKIFFPQAMMMGEATGTDTGANQAAAPATPDNLPKNDKPVVELFVMTHCPYGTQMEKGILPVAAALGNKIDFSIKFNDYAMHGEKELDESLIQYCVQKEQNDKFSNYLTCFLKNETQGAACLTSAKVDTNKMQACVAATDKAFKVKENFKNNVDFRGTFPGFNVQKEDNTKYSVGGSPTLIINGTEAQTGRDSASLLKTICAAFTDQPKECESVLSSATPAPGFGEGTTAAAAAASCE